MSGHNKWSGIKHRKAAVDAKRSNVFTKFARLVTIAAREGGGDPATNLKLKFAIDQAKKANMPKDNIERAIKKGTGELKDGAEIEEITYEAYGPGNVAMLIKTATDNRNRTVGEVKTILTKNGGKFVSSGSVAFLFQQMGVIEATFPSDINKEDAELIAIEAGAEDIELENDIVFIKTQPEQLWNVKNELEENGLEVQNASLQSIATQQAEILEKERSQYESLIEKLQDLDDVQEVYDNL